MNLMIKYKNLPLKVKATIWFLICNFLEKGVSVITIPVFTRLLNTKEYGEYNIFSSWLSILTIFISLNLYSGVFSQGVVKFEKERKEFISSLQGLSFLLFLFWGCVGIFISKDISLIFQMTFTQFLMLLVIIWTNSIFGFWSMSERIKFEYKNLIKVTILVTLLKPSIGIALVYFSEQKVNARIFSLMLVNLVYIYFFLRQVFIGKKIFIKKFWKYALVFNIPLIPHYLSSSILSSADRIMIGKMIGAKEAGIYSLAYTVALIITIFNSALFQTIEPWLYIKLREKEEKEISKVAYPCLILIASLNIFLIAFAPEVIKIFAPKEYYEAIWIIPPVAMSVYFMFSYTFFAVFEFYYEKTRYIAVSTMLGAILNIVLNYIFIREFGYIFAGYTTLICYIIYAVMHYYFMRKICKEKLNGIEVYDKKMLVLISIGFIGISTVFTISYLNRYIRYSLILILCLILIMKKKKIIKFIKGLIKLKNKGS